MSFKFEDARTAIKHKTYGWLNLPLHYTALRAWLLSLFLVVIVISSYAVELLVDVVLVITLLLFLLIVVQIKGYTTR
jgi:FtsH-binding integral membrane protein